MITVYSFIWNLSIKTRCMWDDDWDRIREPAESRLFRMQPDTSKINDAVAVLMQNDNEDDSDFEERESDGSEMEDNVDKASCDAESTSNAGWADAMQKILKTNKPKRKKTVVLAKAKKLCDVRKNEKKEDLSFEIDDVKEEIKTESEEVTNKTSIAANKSAPTKLKITKKSGIRLKPSITDREHERMLQKIATKGVVQLFNAVKQQQMQIDKKLTEAGPLERKREQVYKSIDKNAFLDILMGGSKSIPVDNAVKSETQTNDKDKDQKMWSVLRDDFVMGAKLKDWDKKNVEEEDSSAPEDMDSDVN